MKLNLGMAYAIWCGVGIVVTTLISAVVFREKVSTLGDFWNCMHYDWVRDFKYEWNRSMTGSFLLKGRAG